MGNPLPEKRRPTHDYPEMFCVRLKRGCLVLIRGPHTTLIVIVMLLCLTFLLALFALGEFRPLVRWLWDKVSDDPF